MHASYDDSTRGRSTRGPAVYYGFCGRTNRYRMMDLPDYMENMQQGVSRLMSDASSMYQDVARGYGGTQSRQQGGTSRGSGGCGCGGGCDDRHCECHVCDADVLVHARCGEIRRIPVTFENDTRRERPVKLELESFKTADGRDLKWTFLLSETEFTLKPCDEHTVTVAVQVRCEAFGGEATPVDPSVPKDTDPTGVRLGNVAGAANNSRFGSVDRCEVGYARLRADGCLIRPVVLAIAVLPDDCDALHHSCSCGCCH